MRSAFCKSYRTTTILQLQNAGDDKEPALLPLFSRGCLVELNNSIRGRQREAASAVGAFLIALREEETMGRDCIMHKADGNKEIREHGRVSKT